MKNETIIKTYYGHKSIKLLIYVVISILTFFAFSWFREVNALVGGYGDYLTDTIVSESGMFYDVNSNGVFTSKGYEVTTIDGVSYAKPSNTLTTTYNGGGMGLAQCGMSFVSDNYYSVTYYFITQSAYFHPFYTMWSYKLNFSTNYNFTYFGYTFDNSSSGIEQIQIPNTSDYIGSFTIIFKAPVTSTCLITSMSTNTTTTSEWWAYLGYKYEHLGNKPLTETQIQNALSANFTALENNINNLKSEQEKTNSKLDEIETMQPDTTDTPDDSSYKDYENSQKELEDYINQADTSILDVAIDTDTSNFIWDTMTSLIKSNALVFSTIIALLSIGIIKLALNR